jgi:cold shock CspA family protein
MWCGIPLADPGAGFIEHVKVSLDCFIQWQDFRNNMKRESGGT